MSSEKRRERIDFLKTALTLFAIAAIVAILLALANFITAPIIERSAKERLNQSLNSLMPDAINFDDITDSVQLELAVPVFAIYQGKDQADVGTGYCVHVAPTGYSDTIEMIVAINNEGAVSGVRILSISDTPGVGMKVDSDVEFQNSVLGLTDVAKAVKSAPASENEVQVISGATVSSSAFIDGVNAAIETVQMLTQEVVEK